MYFPFLKLQNRCKRSAEIRRRICAVLPKKMRQYHARENLSCHGGQKRFLHVKGNHTEYHFGISKQTITTRSYPERNYSVACVIAIKQRTTDLAFSRFFCCLSNDSQKNTVATEQIPPKNRNQTIHFFIFSQQSRHDYWHPTMISACKYCNDNRTIF